MGAIMAVWVKMMTELNEVLLQSARPNRKGEYRGFPLHGKFGVEE